MSNIGKPCERALWYELNNYPAEDLKASTFLKFLYGDLVEELMLFLAELAGHKVEGRQGEQEIAGIKGHRDAIIDGHLVDVKSASSYSFKKFADGTLAENDVFGYIPQLRSYHHASQEDEILTDKESASFLAVDKTLGHITLSTIKKEDQNWEKIYEDKKAMVNQAEPPPRGFQPEPFGKSGNMKLGVNCSYCPFKKTCYPNLRTFVYSSGPVFMTKVVREPDVPESS